MTVYVTIETCQGVVQEPRAFLTETSAKSAEQEWLEENRIKDESHRQAKADSGTEFLVFEAELRPQLPNQFVSTCTRLPT